MADAVRDGKVKSGIEERPALDGLRCRQSAWQTVPG